jgi:hypothetical protein
MQRPVRFGVSLPQLKRSRAEAREPARSFEAPGFNSGLPRA